MNASVMIREAVGRGELARIAVDVGEDDPLRHSKPTLEWPASARFMNSTQIGSAACAPLKPTGWLSSKPTQTTVSSSGVKPTNHASRRSLVVPVLPAASSVNPAARTPAPVPSLITLRIMFVTRNVVSGRATSRGNSAGDVAGFVMSLPPRVIFSRCLSGRIVPMFGKMV